jgi:hypothetical protein
MDRDTKGRYKKKRANDGDDGDEDAGFLNRGVTNKVIITIFLLLLGIIVLFQNPEKIRKGVCIKICEIDDFPYQNYTQWKEEYGSAYQTKKEKI